MCQGIYIRESTSGNLHEGIYIRESTSGNLHQGIYIRPAPTRGLWILLPRFCSEVVAELVVVDNMLRSNKAERQPIVRTCWRCFVWCTAAKELHSLLWTIPRKSSVCDHKSTLPPDSSENRLLDLRQQLCCRLTKEQKWQLLFDRNWRDRAPSSQTKWLVYLRKWKVTVANLQPPCSLTKTKSLLG